MERKPSRVQPGSVQRSEEGNKEKPAEQYPVPDSTTESVGDEPEKVEGVAEFGRYPVQTMSPVLGDGSPMRMMREPNMRLPADISFAIAPRAERVSNMRRVMNQTVAWSGRLATGIVHIS